MTDREVEAITAEIPKSYKLALLAVLLFAVAVAIGSLLYIRDGGQGLEQILLLTGLLATLYGGLVCSAAHDRADTWIGKTAGVLSFGVVILGLIVFLA